MNRHLWTGLLAAAAAWVACGPGGEAELIVTAVPRNIRSDGLDAAIITVAAKDENGAVGKGVVRITSVGGSLSSGLDVELDAYGKATATLTCDKAVDASCTGDVRVVAEWSRPGKLVVSGSSRITIDGTGTGTGGSGGSGGSGGGGGTGFNCPNAQALCRTAPNAAVFVGVSPIEYWKLPTEVNGSIKQVSTTDVALQSASCTGSTCTDVRLTAQNLAADGGVTDFFTWDGRRTSPVPIEFAGSMDTPTLRLGTYTDGKRAPPVSSQPFFDTNLCPTSHVVTFDVCRLTVSGGVVQEVLLSFHARCTHMYTVEVDGCIHFTR